MPQLSVTSSFVMSVARWLCCAMVGTHHCSENGRNQDDANSKSDHCERERLIGHACRIMRLIMALLIALFVGGSGAPTGRTSSARSLVPTIVGAEASLNVHSCVPDYIIASLRDRMYVSYDQVIPRKLAMPVCDSLSGPSCPHLNTPVGLFIPSTPHQYNDLYGAYVHRFPVRIFDTNTTVPASGLQLFHPLTLGSFERHGSTYFSTRSAEAEQLSQHSLNSPYVTRALFLEDGIGDVSAAQSLSNAISTAISQLGGSGGVMNDLWGNNTRSSTDSMICFHFGDTSDHSDCHDAKDFPTLPRNFEAEVTAIHSGWTGSSHMLVFDYTQAPFTGPTLESYYGWGLPIDSETNWTGRWIVGWHPFSTEVGPAPLPLISRTDEFFGTEDSGNLLRIPHRRLSTFVTLRSPHGSVFHSSLFVPYAIWIAVEDNPEVEADKLNLSEDVKLVLEGYQDDERMIYVEVSLKAIREKIAELRAMNVGQDFCYVNLVDYLKSTPWLRVDVLKFKYKISPGRCVGGVSAEPCSYHQPYFAILGGLHILMSQKTLRSKYHFMVDKSTEEGRRFKRFVQERIEANEHLSEQRKLLKEKNAANVNALLGKAPPPPLKRLSRSKGTLAALLTEEDSRELASFFGTVFRSIQDDDATVVEVDDLVGSRAIVSWQQGRKIRFGKYDPLNNMYADLRLPLKKSKIFSQQIPAEAPVVSLNQLENLGQVFFRKPTSSSTGGFEDSELAAAGIGGDLPTAVSKILENLSARKSSAASSPRSTKKAESDTRKGGTVAGVDVPQQAKETLYGDTGKAKAFEPKASVTRPAGVQLNILETLFQLPKAPPVSKSKAQGFEREKTEKGTRINADGTTDSVDGVRDKTKDKIPGKSKPSIGATVQAMLVGPDGQVVDLTNPQGTGGVAQLHDAVSEIMKKLGPKIGQINSLDQVEDLLPEAARHMQEMFANGQLPGGLGSFSLGIGEEASERAQEKRTKADDSKGTGVSNTDVDNGASPIAGDKSVNRENVKSRDSTKTDTDTDKKRKVKPHGSLQNGFGGMQMPSGAFFDTVMSLMKNLDSDVLSKVAKAAESQLGAEGVNDEYGEASDAVIEENGE